MVWEWNWVEDPRLAHQKRFQISPFSTFQFSISILPIGHPDISDLVLAKQATTLLAPPLPSTDHQHLSWQDINVHCPTGYQIHWWLIFRGICQPGTQQGTKQKYYISFLDNLCPPRIHKFYYWYQTMDWNQIITFVSIWRKDSNLIDIPDTCFFVKKEDCVPLEQWLLSSFLPLPFLLSSCPL